MKNPGWLQVYQTRRVVQRRRNLPMGQMVDLLHPPWHQKRLLALLIWSGPFGRGGALSTNLPPRTAYEACRS